MKVVLGLCICWAGCGFAAFVVHLVRQRIRTVSWFEMPVLILATTLLGVIALVAVLTNDDDKP